IRAAADQTAANIRQRTLETDVNTHAHFIKLADDARIAYEYATAHADQYSADWIQKLRDTADAAQLAANTWGTAFETNMQRINVASTQTAAKVVTTWQTAMGLVAQGLGVMSGTVGNAPLTAENKAKVQAAWDENRYFG